MSSNESPPILARRRFRVARWAFALTFLASVVAAYLLWNPVQSLRSLRRIPGTNAYVMDYYGDYNLEQVRREGIDHQDIEGSFIRVLMPRYLAPIVERVKRAYIPKPVRELGEVSSAAHHCSTVALRADADNVFFGRNFDYGNDACLLLRVHDRNGIKSLAVVDLAYLNLNRSDLDRTSLVERLPLLFAPYYLMDGINRHGVAVADMSVPEAKPPLDPDKPHIIQSTLMRLILDQARSTSEAIEIVREFNVHFVEQPEHFLIADASGDFRVVEFVDGEIRLTTPTGSRQVCTNHSLWGKSEEENDQICPRYRAGSDAADRRSGQLDLNGTRDIARSMSVDNWTMWTSAYDLRRGEMRLLYRARPDTEHRESLVVVPVSAAPKSIQRPQHAHTTP